MRNSAGEQSPQSTGFVRTKLGKAEFHRNSPIEAILEIEYDVPALRTDLADRPLSTAVESLCEAEISMMRRSLQELGEALAEQLSGEGKKAVIDHSFRDRDSREWADAGRSFEILPSQFRNVTKLNGYEGVADAELVRRSVELLVTQREQSIRALYGKIIADAHCEREKKDRRRDR
jgi:hypothetical protein